MSLGRVVGPIYADLMLDVNLNYPCLSGTMILLIAVVLMLGWIRREANRAIVRFAEQREQLILD